MGTLDPADKAENQNTTDIQTYKISQYDYRDLVVDHFERVLNELRAAKLKSAKTYDDHAQL